jgi:PAS domain S-box-containing protein
MKTSEVVRSTSQAVSVLLVEDNPADIGLVRDMLDDSQFELEVTHRVTSAVSLLASDTFDVVLLDLTLPDSDGLESFEAIHAAAPQIPIIVLTGLDDEVLAGNSMKGGAQDYLIKGQIDSKLLSRSIRYGIERKRILSENERIRREAENAHREAVTLNEVNARLYTALRESEIRFRNMADHAPALIWVDNLKGCEFVNRSYLDFVGASFKDVEGMNWLQFVHADDKNDLSAKYEEAVTKGARFEAELRFRRHDGEYRWIRSIGVPRRNEAGTSLGYVGCSIDISDIKNSEAALKDADRRKDEFLATLAHELRNPLAPIRNAIQILKLTSNGSRNAERSLTIMERQVEHMVRLIDDLLDVNRISQGKIELRIDEIDLRTVLTHALEASQPVIDNFGHSLIIDIADQMIPINGDLIRLAQVFENVLNNAAKYTNQGGRIWLKATVDASSVCVSVKDDGVGIEPSMLDKVFEMFMQLEGSEKRSSSGLGIGLSITKNLVEMHGGTISAKSNGIGRGSEFIVSLPLAACLLVVNEVDAPGVPN